MEELHRRRFGLYQTNPLCQVVVVLLDYGLYSSSISLAAT